MTRGANHFPINVYFVFPVVSIMVGGFCYTQILYIVAFSEHYSLRPS